MHTEKQLVISLSRDNEVNDDLLDQAKTDEELLRSVLELMVDLRVDPDIGFGPSHAMLTTRKAQLERKLQQRLSRA